MAALESRIEEWCCGAYREGYLTTIEICQQVHKRFSVYITADRLREILKRNGVQMRTRQQAMKLAVQKFHEGTANGKFASLR